MPPYQLDMAVGSVEITLFGCLPLHQRGLPSKCITAPIMVRRPETVHPEPGIASP